jgi:hypothetical protein
MNRVKRPVAAVLHYTGLLIIIKTLVMKKTLILVLTVLTVGITEKAGAQLYAGIGAGASVSMPFQKIAGSGVSYRDLRDWCGNGRFWWKRNRTYYTFEVWWLINGIRLPEVRISYLEPRLLAGYLLVEKSRFSLGVNGGPGFGYAVSGRTKINGVSNDIDFSRDGIKRGKFTLNIGADGNFALNSRTGIFISARESFGLGDIDKDVADKLRYNNLSFAAGLNFKLK